MNRKAGALTTTLILFIGCLAIPVSAFYFDFQYFETDKLVYEVGETIDMVAKLIADFSTEGWCFVSFAVVTDLGPSFADEYFISPSPTVRYLNSSYTILPEHTSPGVSGVQAFVLFTIEIYDTVSQSAGDNIQVIINRGHLTATPLTNPSVEFGLNTSIPLKIASTHNMNVVYNDEPVNLHVEDPESQTILDLNTTTTSEGLVYLNWSDSFGFPGVYNLTVSCDGNEDFLPFSNSLDITVLPASSNLTIISSPESVYCQSPDGNHVEQAEIIVEHTDSSLNPLDASIVQWTSIFNSGILTNIGNGLYSAVIPFNTSPGPYQINFTATNPQYQAAETSINMDVKPNGLFLSAEQTCWNVTRGNNVTVEFFIESTIDWNQPIQLQFIDETFQFSIVSDIQTNISTSVIIPIWHNITVGQHIVIVSPVSEYYEFTTISIFNLTVIGTMNVVVSPKKTYYGEFLDFNMTLLDDNSQSVSLADIHIFCDDIFTPLAIINDANPITMQSISLPLSISPGLHNITFEVINQYYRAINYTITLKVWMRTNITIVISSDSTETITNSFNDSQDFIIIRRISSGSIILPPPILFRGITSTDPATTRLTSLDN